MFPVAADISSTTFASIHATLLMWGFHAPFLPWGGSK